MKGQSVRNSLTGYRITSSVLGLALVITIVGCTTSAPPRTSGPSVEREDEIGAVRETLRRDVDLEDCKTAVAQLNAALGRPDAPRPTPLTNAQLEFARSILGLSDDDLNELQREQFSAADAYFLEEVMLLNDVVRSLKLSKSVSIADRADRIASWVMRQVWLLEHRSKPLPPTSVLRIGYGNTFERGLVLLATFQQAGIEAGWIAEAKESRSLKPWAVGALIDGQVRLFDPRSGQALRDADGVSPLTLKEAKAKPEKVKPLVEAADPGVDFRQAIPASRVWLSPPIFALSSRMRWLQSVMDREPPVVLAIDMQAALARWQQSGEPALVWLSREDSLTPGRVLLDNVSISEGGRSTDPPGSRLYDRCRLALIPMAQTPVLLRNNEITGELRDRLLAVFSARFLELALEPNKPRDLILRGQFDEASRALSDALSTVHTTQQRVGAQQDLEREAARWATEMQAATAALSRMRDRPQPGDDLAAARNKVETLNKSAGKMILLIEQAAAEPYAAALTYQMALCLHEQAERRSWDRSSVEEKRALWTNALSWWNNYLTRFSTASWIPAAQIDHARSLQASARKRSQPN
jgi:hypothetical protein